MHCIRELCLPHTFRRNYTKRSFFDFSLRISTDSELHNLTVFRKRTEASPFFRKSPFTCIHFTLSRLYRVAPLQSVGFASFNPSSNTLADFFLPFSDTPSIHSFHSRNFEDFESGNPHGWRRKEKYAYRKTCFLHGWNRNRSARCRLSSVSKIRIEFAFHALVLFALFYFFRFSRRLI